MGSPTVLPKALHIGFGRTRLDGFVNIDVVKGCDLQIDLEKDRAAI